MEVFEKHASLVELFAAFGFEALPHRTRRNELILAKQLVPRGDTSNLSALRFHELFGPKAVRISDVPGFVVPIIPEYHRLLFPDGERQLPLVCDLKPFGNAIRKAYLCHSPIRRITPGAFLLFYRTQDEKAVTVLGVAEETLISRKAEEIARFVGKRTVYSLQDIASMTDQREVLAILFRQSRVLEEPLHLDALRQHGVVAGSPQSIATVRSSSVPWLATQLDALY